VLALGGWPTQTQGCPTLRDFRRVGTVLPKSRSCRTIVSCSNFIGFKSPPVRGCILSALRDWGGVGGARFGRFVKKSKAADRVSALHGLCGGRDPSTAHAGSLRSPACFAQDDKTLGGQENFKMTKRCEMSFVAECFSSH
jgi:hypothetical protein